MSAAAYEMLHVVEVMLRNTIDRQVRTWNETQRDPAGRVHAAEWTLDPSRLLSRLVGQDLEKARRRARSALAQRSGNRPVTHDDVVAQLTMGTWRYLLPDRDAGRRRLWVDAVSAGFPHLSRSERDLVDDVDGLYRLRNRVAHLEPLISVGIIVPQLAAARRTLHDIAPDSEAWMVSHQTVTRVARERPTSPKNTNGPLSEN